MLFSKKPITFVRKASILTRNQLSLFKLIRNILLVDQHDVMYARPAYHVFDVDERNNSKSNIKKGREMVGKSYLDILVIESESLRAICAFRMDDNGDKKASKWSKETRNLVAAAESAKFPLFIVANTKSYSTEAIIAQIKTTIPVSKFASQHRTPVETKDSIEGKEVENEMKGKIMSAKQKDENDPWSKGQLK